MIKRYQDPVITALWNEENKLRIWILIEQLTVAAWNETGIISVDEWKKLKTITTSYEAVKKIEMITQHELAAVVDCLSDGLGAAGRWIHYGLTSNDVLDTTDHYLMKASLTHILNGVEKLVKMLSKKANKEKYTLMVGRTHGIHAEPITLGFKIALWAAELQRHFVSLTSAQMTISVVKIAGPTGLIPDIPLSVSEYVAKKLEMKVSYGNTQIIPRDMMLKVVFAVQNLSITIEKIAIELRNLQRSEISEFQEPFAKGQKGSSAMPHKKNPIVCENICGLSRLLKGFASSLQSVNLLWHERDLSNSSIERVALPDMFHLLGTMLSKIYWVIDNGVFLSEQIKKNLANALGSIISHKLVLWIIKYKKLTRGEAYKIVQNLQLTLGETKKTIIAKIQKNPILANFTEQNWDEIASEKSYTKNIDKIFEKFQIN